jgi:branched-chain amino acid transport system substrate-binding protein
LGGDGWDSEKLGEIAGDSINGCFYSNHYAPEGPDPHVQEFLKKYKAHYGGTPDCLAGLGYDSAKIVCDAIGKAGSLKGADIAAQLSKVKDFESVTGKISIDANRNAVKPAVILEMKNGKPTYVTTIQPE